ncbi:MAG: hypothetical protein WC422_02355 [Candidatus Paceibacterota bacterium]
MARCKTTNGIIYGTTKCVSDRPSGAPILPTSGNVITSGDNINVNPLIAVDE